MIIKNWNIVIDWSNTVWCYSLDNITWYTIWIEGESTAARFEDSVMVPKHNEENVIICSETNLRQLKNIDLFLKMQKTTFEIAWQLTSSPLSLLTID